jgi:hypothetical protein
MEIDESELFGWLDDFVGDFDDFPLMDYMEMYELLDPEWLHRDELTPLPYLAQLDDCEVNVDDPWEMSEDHRRLEQEHDQALRQLIDYLREALAP